MRNSKEQLKAVRKRLREAGISRRRTFATLTCMKCKRQYKIQTNKEGKKRLTEKEPTYICMLCKPVTK